jgi:hypothetical protein
MKNNYLGSSNAIKYLITNTDNKTTCVFEHEFKHYLRHNNLKSGDYNIAGFSSITNSYIVYVYKQANKYSTQRLKINKK